MWFDLRGMWVWLGLKGRIGPPRLGWVYRWRGVVGGWIVGGVWFRMCVVSLLRSEVVR